MGVTVTHVERSAWQTRVPWPPAFLAVIGGGLLLRVLLVPFMHHWDGHTFLNMFAELAHGGNVYESFWEQTLAARSRWHAGRAFWYEYYAYPPFLIYLYTPLALVANAITPLHTVFLTPGADVVGAVHFPLAFLVAFKLPILVADLFITHVIWSRTRSVGLAALWFVNPLVVLVSGAWMFDAIPVALTLGAVLAFERERVTLAGVLLALGFLAKFYPLFVFPVLFMHLVWRRDPRVLAFTGAFAGTSLVLIAPFYPEIAHVFAFNAGRTGGGLALQQIALSWFQIMDANPLRFETVTSPLVGTLMLVGGVSATYWWLNRHRPPVLASVTLTLLVFLLVTKLVNEPYALWVLPFLLLMVPDAASRVHALAAFHLLWLVPFAYLSVRVPLTAFVPAWYARWGGSFHTLPWFHGFSIAATLAFAAVLVYALRAYRPREVPA